jgi:magnesium-transporting ATPase (P-type)
MFYKNTELVMCMMWYSLIHASSSGLNIYANGWRTAFAVCYTGLPILLVGVFERDVDADYAEKNPLLYLTGPSDFFFNDGVFWYWVGSAIVESLLITELTVACWQFGHEHTSTGASTWWGLLDGDAR